MILLPVQITPFSDRDLMQIELRTMFRLDSQGRIEAVNESGDSEAPRVFVGRCGDERLTRVRRDIPESVGRRWLACADDQSLVALVSEHAPIQREHRGPAFVLSPIPNRSEGATLIGPRSVLHPELTARGWHLAETPPYIGVESEGLVVAVCYSSRLGAEAAEAGVETVTDFRGRGLAERAVSAWANAVQRSGKLAFYSTTWENAASRRIAEKLRARQFGEDWHLT